MSNVPETREQEGIKFAEYVRKHCTEYTILQYGNKGDDQVTDGSIEDLITQIKKYCHRYGNNAREGQEHLDFMKIAHYACMAYGKYIEQGKNETKKIFTFSGMRDTIINEIKELPYEKSYEVHIKEK